MSRSRLSTGISIDTQGVTAFPLDSQPARHTHDVPGAIRAALATMAASCFGSQVFRDAPAFRIEGKDHRAPLVRREPCGTSSPPSPPKPSLPRDPRSSQPAASGQDVERGAWALTRPGSGQQRAVHEVFFCSRDSIYFFALEAPGRQPSLGRTSVTICARCSPFTREGEATIFDEVADFQRARRNPLTRHAEAVPLHSIDQRTVPPLPSGTSSWMLRVRIAGIELHHTCHPG